MGYPGSKAASGVCERIISQMPVHRVYVELFCGAGAVARRKRPAEKSIAVDLDPSAPCLTWQDPGWDLVNADALEFVRQDPYGVLHSADTVVYADPPYLGSVRTRRFYRCEMWSDSSHTEMLEALLGLRCRVLISGYPSALYERLLVDWRCVQYRTQTRGGPRVECLWCNFPAGLPLHDTRFVGDGFRERDRIRRKCHRWITRLMAMPPAERQYILERVLPVPGGIVEPDGAGLQRQGDADEAPRINGSTPHEMRPVDIRRRVVSASPYLPLQACPVGLSGMPEDFRNIA